MTALLRRLPLRLLLAAAVLAAAAALLLLVLTRTQVGRDQVARHIERQFDRQFDGSLEIERLTGNLLYDLYGRGVVVRDPQGHAVLSADSVVLRPRWQALLANRLELRSVKLIRPLVDLRQDEGGGWNIAEAFRQTAPPREADGDPLGLNAAEVRLVDGALRTRSDAPPPPLVRDGTLFDYTNTRLTDLHALLDLDFKGRARRLHVARLSGSLPDLGVTLRRASGTLDFTAEGTAAEGVSLELGGTRIAGDFRIARGDGPDRLTASLRPSRLDARELRRLAPAWPLADAIDAELQAEGPLADVTLQRLRLARGRSSVEASGTLSGLPDSLRYGVEVGRLVLRGDDLVALLPGAAPDLDGLGTVRGSARAQGSIAWADGLRTRTDARLDLGSDAGALRGQFRLATAPGAPPRYQLDARVRDLDPGRALGRDDLAGRLNGVIALDAVGITRPRGRVRLDLGPGAFGGRHFDALATNLSVDGLRFEGAAAVQVGGGLAVEGVADLAASVYDLRFRADSLDLRSFAPEAPPTALTGEGTLVASGGGLDALTADLDLALQGATVTLRDSVWVLPEGPVRLAARPAGADGPRLALATEALDLRVEGPFRWEGVVPLAAAWGERLGEALRAEADKPLHTPLPSRSPLARIPGGWPAQEVQVSLLARREGALRPWLEDVSPGAEAHAWLTIGSDTLSLRAGAEGSGLRAAGVALAAFEGEVVAQVGADDDPLDQLTLAASARADTLSLPPGTARPPFTLRPRLDARFHPEARTLTLRADAFRFADSVAVSGEVDVTLLRTRNRLAGSFALDAPGQAWSVDRGVVDLYADALVFEAFEVVRTRAPNGANGTYGAGRDRPDPRLALRGVASARPEDTLEIVAEALDLSEVLTLAGVDLPFDGLGQADLAVTGALGQPALVGSATVDDFALWGDVAGRITATSEIVPGREGFSVDLRLRPQSPDAPIRNDARLTGSLRLPGRTPEGGRDPGFFDLAARFDRLDLFFLDGLFPDIIANTTGGGAGDLTIGGDWSFPLFNGQLEVGRARTTVPAFNLAVGAAGRVEVDREGIHFRNVRVSDKAGGSGFVRGALRFNEYRFFSLDLAGDLAEFEVIDVSRLQAGTLPFYGHIRASGSATLTGPIDDARLRSTDAQTTPDSQIFIPVVASGPTADFGFLVFADAAGRVPEPEVRQSLIGERPEGERPFLDGLQMNLNVLAPSGSTVHLVFDPVIGDVITAVGSGRIQLAIVEDEFQTFGTFEVERGSYLFTAGDVFTRRFELERGGTLSWDGDPIDARLDLPASYRTRASLAGLGLAGVDDRQRVPFVVGLQVGGRVTGPLVELSLALDEGGGRAVPAAEALRRRLNESDRQAEYATSVLLTNTFLLAPSDGTAGLSQAADDLLFTSLSELVSTRLSLFLNQALGADNLDVAVGVQQGATAQDLDLTYGVALRLLDERLIIRGEGLYQQLENRTATEALQGEVAVEVRLADGVALEVFYRREGELLLGAGLAAAPTGAYGAGVSYQTDFPNWRWLVRRLLGTPPDPRRPAPPPPGPTASS